MAARFRSTRKHPCSNSPVTGVETPSVGAKYSLPISYFISPDKSTLSQTNRNLINRHPVIYCLLDAEIRRSFPEMGESKIETTVIDYFAARHPELYKQFVYETRQN